ncbi:MAG: hypothetical protein K9L79_01145 [Methylobacter tundripaludum]|jgi:hypothetical protein|uniref:hypothetical protein n=1 Tax=Methylobacter tundripaludum TaxID=173365 RepID=UPI0011B07BFC|nr:hypothetical protein [Methylobacter tundripaludum]MCF7964123.1 hypothetical protein [Methylobacter tundripaludum]MCK9637273.1 hypothetical protein [Methylobacter tundripaludum]
MGNSIIPVSGTWNWVSEKQDDENEITFPVACWIMNNETGFVSGLIALDANYGGHEKNITDSSVTRLASPPPIPGRYIRIG